MDPGVAGEFGKVCLKKERRKRHKLLVIELFLDFAKNTTLHGLRYTTERGLSVVEKVFWLLTFLISVGLCSYYISKVWIKLKTTPIIVSYNEKIVPVGTVPFPSVTICPGIKSKRSVFNFTEMFEEYCKFEGYIPYPSFNCSAEDDDGNFESEKLVNIGLICDVANVSITSMHQHTNPSVVKDIDEVAPKVADVFQLCVWQGDIVDCNEIFKRALTGEGVCYNFNGLSAEDIFREDSIQQEYSYIDATEKRRGWNLSSGYWYDERNPYPRRGRENGAGPDLEIILKNDQNEEDLLCNNMGYKIYVQHPADMPTNSLYYYAVMPNQVTSVALKLNMLTSSTGLRSYDPERRQCYFDQEKPLKYFKIYTEKNCIIECSSEYSRKLCRFMPFYLPFSDEYKNVINNMNRFERYCMKLVQRIAYDPNLRKKYCKCLPECDRINYDADVLKTDFAYSSYLESFSLIAVEESFEIQDDMMEGVEYLKHLNSYDKSLNYSKVEVYFKEPYFISIRRSELFGTADFLSYCGGILGLFLGFSLLSLFEILYFCTLRLICRLRRDRKAEETKYPKSG